MSETEKFIIELDDQVSQPAKTATRALDELDAAAETASETTSDVAASAKKTGGAFQSLGLKIQAFGTERMGRFGEVLSGVSPRLLGMAAAATAVVTSVAAVGIGIVGAARGLKALSDEFQSARRAEAAFSEFEGGEQALRRIEEFGGRISVPLDVAQKSAKRLLGTFGNVEDAEKAFAVAGAAAQKFGDGTAAAMETALDKVAELGTLQEVSLSDFETTAEQLGTSTEKLLQNTADAYGMTVKELEQAVKDGKVAGNALVNGIASAATGSTQVDAIKRVAEESADPVSSAFTRIGNAWDRLKQRFAGVLFSGDLGIEGATVKIEEFFFKIGDWIEQNEEFVSSFVTGLKFLATTIGVVAGIVITTTAAIVAGIGFVIDQFSKIGDIDFGFISDKIMGFFSGLGQSIMSSGQSIMNMLAQGIKSAAAAPFTAVKDVVGKVRRLLPFSPAKEGPLKDLDKIKLVETLADSVEPEPLVNRVSSVLDVATQAEPSATAAQPTSLDRSTANNTFNITVNTAHDSPMAIAAAIRDEMATLHRRLELQG